MVMRGYMREKNISDAASPEIAASIGMSPHQMERMFRLLAIAKYEDRYVIPPAHRELAHQLDAQQGTCGLDFAGGPGNCASEASPAPGGGRNEAFYAQKEELEWEAARQGHRKPNVNFFKRKADFEAFHLKGSPNEGEAPA